MNDSPVVPPHAAVDTSLIQPPPRSIPGILQKLGPGLIIAGSIVGSGELIATTKTGAEAGFWLLWLIVIGCVIKVFAQVEFGRYTLVSGHTAMDGMNQVPGPRVRVNWLVGYWFIVFLASIGQLGGIVGAVGQSLAIGFPITGDFNRQLDILERQAEFDRQQADPGINPNVQFLGRRPTLPLELADTNDDVYWSVITTVITAVLLVIGRYGLIQSVSTFLVASFTVVTIFCLVAQQMLPEWAVRWEDLREGFSFRLPPAVSGITPLATALATFGIIGVGANELIAYPYFCLEKGYATFTGPRDASSAWAERARGWMRVMRWDAWCSMVVYTFATIGFYMLGAGVLHRQGLNPSGKLMIHTLAEMYKPTFGAWAGAVFLFGAFAVLYSTFFVAIAGHARVAADAVRVARLGASTPQAMNGWVRWLCLLLPFASLGVYMAKKDPVALVLLGGLAQAIMLPMLGAAAVYFRYRRCDDRIRPGRAWDFCLWLSFAGLLVTGVWGAFENFEHLVALVKSLF